MVISSNKPEANGYHLDQPFLTMIQIDKCKAICANCAIVRGQLEKQPFLTLIQIDECKVICANCAIVRSQLEKQPVGSRGWLPSWPETFEKLSVVWFEKEFGINLVRSCREEAKICKKETNPTTDTSSRKLQYFIF